MTEIINDEYSYSTYNNIKVIIHNKTGFINATKLCSLYGKRYNHYTESNKKKEFINNIGLNSHFLIKAGGKNNNLKIVSGTYVHKDIIDDIIYWCQNTKNNQHEKDIVNNYIKNIKCNYQLEVPVSCGRIDILTDTEIIEVKEGCSWKGALGQILIYGHFYPDKKMRVHLFDVTPFKGDIDIKLIKTIYKKHNVELSYE